MVYTASEQIIEVKCANCGVSFGITESYAIQKLKDRNTFFCPNGHSQRFPGKTDADRLKELQDQLQRERQQHDQQIAESRERLKHANRSRDAFRGQVTKVKGRISKGACPCCNRHFENLHRHMVVQHPDFSGKDVRELIQTRISQRCGLPETR